MKTGKILSGISGEYFVAGELSRNGYVAALTLRNNADSDIITTTSDGTKSFNIQVKTKRKDRSNVWQMGGHALETRPKWDNNFYYVFVSISDDLKDNKVDYYVIPKNIANKKIEDKHQLWLSGKKKSGEARKSQVRTLGMNTISNFEDYRNEKGWAKLKNSIK